MTQITEVDGLTTIAEKQQTVETLEQQRRRLVNSTQDGLTLGSQFPKETDEIPSALTVKT